MQDGHMIILLSYFVLHTIFFTVATEIGSVVTAEINERITDATYEVSAKDDHRNISTNLSPHREFTNLSNEFSQNDVTEPQSNSSLLQQLEISSCEIEATEFGYKNNLQVILHGIFCELNKLLRYFLIAMQNLKSEFHIVIQYDPMQDTISLNEPILNKILSDIVGRPIIRLEEFLENDKNVKALLNSVKKCIPISNIQISMNRLDIAVTKLLTNIQETFAYLEFHNDDETVKDMMEKIFIAKDEIVNLLHGYSTNNSNNATNLFLSTIRWIELVFDTLKIYVQKRLYIYLTVLEEFTDIVNAFYDGYCASELSKTINYLVYSTSESYNLLSSSTTVIPLPEDIREGSILDTSQIFQQTSIEDSRIQSFSGPLIRAHSPNNINNFSALDHVLSESNDTRNSKIRPDRNLLPKNYGQSNDVSLNSTSSAFLDINRTSKENSGLSYRFPTTISSITNMFQSFDTNVKEKTSNPLQMPPLSMDKILLEKPFPYTLQPETLPITHSTSDTFLYQTSNQQLDTNIRNSPTVSPFPETRIAENDSLSYAILSNSPTFPQLSNSLPSFSAVKLLHQTIDQNYNESFNSFTPISSLISNSTSKNTKSYVDYSKNANSVLKILYNYPEYRNPLERHMHSRKIIEVH